MKTESIYNEPEKSYEDMLDYAEHILNKNYSVCVIGAADGKFVFPFIEKGHQVDCYEVDKTILYGGKKKFPILDTLNPETGICETEEKDVIGLVERARIEGMLDKINIIEKDFYNNNENIKKYDLVFTSGSIQYILNKNTTLKEKVEKLQNLVNKDGLLCIDYMMANKEENYEKFPSTLYFRKCEMESFFDKKWKICYIEEPENLTEDMPHVGVPKIHYHRIGFLIAKKLED